MTEMLVALDITRAAWFPLLVVFVLGLVVAGLGWSMRHEIRKINLPRATDDARDNDDKA